MCASSHALRYSLWGQFSVSRHVLEVHGLEYIRVIHKCRITPRTKPYELEIYLRVRGLMIGIPGAIRIFLHTVLYFSVLVRTKTSRKTIKIFAALWGVTILTLLVLAEGYMPPGRLITRSLITSDITICTLLKFSSLYPVVGCYYCVRIIDIIPHLFAIIC